MVDVINGEQILIKIGDGADPEVFAHPALINTDRGIAFSSSVNSTPNPDPANPSAPAWNATDKDGLSATISGAGLLDLGDVADYFDWYEGQGTKNVEVVLQKTGGLKFKGAFHLSEFQITGQRKNKATCSITLVSDGAVTRAALS